MSIDHGKLLVACRRKLEAYRDAYGLEYVGGQELSSLLADIDRALAQPAEAVEFDEVRKFIDAQSPMPADLAKCVSENYHRYWDDAEPKAEAAQDAAWTPERAQRLADGCLQLARDVEASKHDDAAQGAVAPFAWYLVGEDGKPAFAPYFKESDADAMIAEYANQRRPEDRETFTKHELFTHPQAAPAQVDGCVPAWIVNDLGELGVEVSGRQFFLYKGENIEYDGRHDDGTPMLYREVGKREFGEVCWPAAWWRAGRREDRYTVELEYVQGLSYGQADDPRYQWKPLPAAAPSQEGES